MYKKTVQLFKSYFEIYGGFKEILRSFYFLTAFFITIFVYNIWINPFWWEMVITIIPNLIGFSIGAFALVLSIDIKKINSNITFEHLVKISNTFTHFIVIQIFSLTLGIIAKSFYASPPVLIIKLFEQIGLDFYYLNHYIKTVFWFICFLVFIYAMLLSLAATMAIYRISTWKRILDMRSNNDRGEK